MLQRYNLRKTKIIGIVYFRFLANKYDFTSVISFFSSNKRLVKVQILLYRAFRIKKCKVSRNQNIFVNLKYNMWNYILQSNHFKCMYKYTVEYQYFPLKVILFEHKKRNVFCFLQDNYKCFIDVIRCFSRILLVIIRHMCSIC